MKLWDANPQVYEKNSPRYSPSCILPSVSKNASRFFRKGFESMRSKFLSENISKK